MWDQGFPGVPQTENLVLWLCSKGYSMGERVSQEHLQECLTVEVHSGAGYCDTGRLQRWAKIFPFQKDTQEQSLLKFAAFSARKEQTWPAKFLGAEVCFSRESVVPSPEPHTR